MSHWVPEEEMSAGWGAWWPQGLQSRAWQRGKEGYPDVITFQETSGFSCPAVGNGLSSWCWEVMKPLRSWAGILVPDAQWRQDAWWGPGSPEKSRMRIFILVCSFCKITEYPRNTFLGLVRNAKRKKPQYCSHQTPRIVDYWMHSWKIGILTNSHVNEGKIIWYNSSRVYAGAS